jgi:hypothetical protein
MKLTNYIRDAFIKAAMDDVRNAVTGRAVATRKDRDGYVICDTHYPKRKTLRVHRVACEAFHGPAPEGKPECDHKNRSRHDNRASNLRWATVSLNRTNTSPRTDMGVKGVRFRADRPRPWQAYCGTLKGFKSLGHFSSFEEAKAARLHYERNLNHD